jgi:hypothetical protein
LESPNNFQTVAVKAELKSIVTFSQYWNPKLQRCTFKIIAETTLQNRGG